MRAIMEIRNDKRRVVGWRVPCSQCGVLVTFIKKNDGPWNHGETPDKPDNTATCAECWDKLRASYFKRIGKETL